MAYYRLNIPLLHLYRNTACVISWTKTIHERIKKFSVEDERFKGIMWVKSCLILRVLVAADLFALGWSSLKTERS